jgi:hypothetical protein
VSISSKSSAQPADGDTASPQCAHCGEEIRRCPGEAALPRWNDRNNPLRSDCTFREGYVHASGERPGSHVFGKDGQVATPALGRP